MVLVALLVPFIILFMRMVLCGVLTHTSVILFNLTKINLLVYILPGVLIGAIGEEVGWRGFLLPILQSKMNALNSSVLLGILWGFYHFPIIIGNGIGIFFVFIINVTLLSIVVTWLYNSTNGSIIITILFHTVINIFTMTIFYSDISIKLYLAQAIATFIVASVILAIYGNKKFFS